MCDSCPQSCVAAALGALYYLHSSRNHPSTRSVSPPASENAIMMKVRIMLGFRPKCFLFSCLLVLSCCLVNRVSTSRMANEVAASSRAFAVDLFHGLRKGAPGNLFFSPFSINAAFGMVFAGAGGSTQQEMLQALHLLSKDEASIHAGFKELLGQMKGGENVTLETANRVYLQENFKVLDAYVSKVQEYYLSAVETVNFGDDSNRVKINSWVEEQTKQKIKDLLPPGSVNGLTRLVLVNAIYFKGNWANQFDPKLTTTMPFHLTSSSTMDVQMMQKKANFNLYDVKELQADIVELPYKGDTMSMILIIPKEIEGLRDVEAALTPGVLEKIMTTRPRKPEVTLFLPKFKLESSFTLSQPLTQLGMKSLFDADSADLSGVTGDKSLYVSEGYHKAFLEVNEEGSEAAAATGVVTMTKSRPVPRYVRADRPFAFLIRHKPSDSVLFVGHLVEPRA